MILGLNMKFELNLNIEMLAKETDKLSTLHINK